MDNTQKLIALFKYIKELNSMKNKIFLNLDEYDSLNLKFSDIPKNNNIKISYYSDETYNEEILVVKKPEFLLCPTPPDTIISWLSPEWDNYKIECEHKAYLPKTTLIDVEESFNVSETEVVYFEESEERITDFNNWMSTRSDWVKEQLIIENTINLFSDLYKAYLDINRENGLIELVVGVGLFNYSSSKNYKHPLLLKKVKFEFDANENIIKIIDTDSDPELYSQFLKSIPSSDLNYIAVKSSEDDLLENAWHPLDVPNATTFLRKLTNNLSSNSRFIDDYNNNSILNEKIIVEYSPVIFVRKRQDGSIRTIEKILHEIETNNNYPNHLLPFIGQYSPNYNSLNSEYFNNTLYNVDTDILLAKEYNQEQIEIANKINHSNTVLVQGPPGTGKTHTIANLIGHFLAQGKTVLVTSHTKKALSVLKNKIPSKIQSLCVSMLEENNKDMEHAVSEILDHIALNTNLSIQQNICDDLEKTRQLIINSLDEEKNKLLKIKHRQYKSISYMDENYTPLELAKELNNNSQLLSIIPGIVKKGPFPLSDIELKKLYKSNIEISADEELEINIGLPDINQLIKPEHYNELLIDLSSEKIILERFKKLKQYDFIYDSKEDLYYINKDNKYLEIASNLNKNILNKIDVFINKSKFNESWMYQAIVDGKHSASAKEHWLNLISLLEDTYSFATDTSSLRFGKTFKIPSDVNLSSLKENIVKYKISLETKSKLKKIFVSINKKEMQTISQVLINNLPITTPEDCVSIISFIDLKEKLNNLEFLWNELVTKNKGPIFKNLNIDRDFKNYIKTIKSCIAWYDEYIEIINNMNNSGFKTANVIKINTSVPENIAIENLIAIINGDLKLYLDLIRANSNIYNINKTILNSINELQSNSPLSLLTKKSLKNKDCMAYEECYNDFVNLKIKTELYYDRVNILEKLKSHAPDWAKNIEDRTGIHNNEFPPANIYKSWKYKQLDLQLFEINSEPYSNVIQNIEKLNKDLLKTTEDLVVSKSWLFLQKRIDLQMSNVLNSWKLTMKKIGKGTGKSAPLLKREARRLMATCQSAVPVWIVDINRALEIFDPSKNIFDIVIVDEASQSDISALSILYFGKKTIIVGDDKQVSPSAVGYDMAEMESIKVHIKEIPNSHLYDGKTSLYDIIKLHNTPIMLREHFRCVPEIIGFSNKLSYDNKIKPLRDSSSSILLPPIIPYKVENGKRAGKYKVNEKEAKTIVSLVLACLEQPEYENQTFGVISLLGNDQSKKIQNLIFEKIPMKIIEERKILCGDASNFQGDERDVVFLSLVDSPDDEGPLRFTGEGTEQSNKQRYNVAASRAKNQLWLVHSLDYKNDLKSGDIRRELLDYCYNYKNIAEDLYKIEEKSDSIFEYNVAKSLIEAGYNITQQWTAGAYKIDIVVKCNNNKVAIECDGEKFHGTLEKIKEDNERQSILERLGWRFIRIRGSEYFRDPNITIKRVIQELNNLDIYPEKKELSQNMNFTLKDVVIERAYKIRNEWQKQKNNSLQNPVGQISFSQLNNPKTLNSTPSLPPRERLKKQALKKTIKRDQNNHSKISNQNNNINNSDFLINDLYSLGFDIIDNRKISNILWVIYSPNKKEEFEKTVKNYTFKYSLEFRGSPATKNTPAWRIMT